MVLNLIFRSSSNAPIYFIVCSYFNFYCHYLLQCRSNKIEALGSLFRCFMPDSFLMLIFWLIIFGKKKSYRASYFSGGSVIGALLFFYLAWRQIPLNNYGRSFPYSGHWRRRCLYIPTCLAELIWLENTKSKIRTCHGRSGPRYDNNFLDQLC